MHHLEDSNKFQNSNLYILITLSAGSIGQLARSEADASNGQVVARSTRNDVTASNRPEPAPPTSPNT